MKIIEIIGGMASGKTTLANSFPSIRRWDIKDNFYIPRGILVKGVMDWDKFNKNMIHLRDVVDDFISSAIRDGEEMVFIEHSGRGKWMMNIMSNYDTERIVLKYPDQEDVIERAIVRGEDVDKIIKFNTDFGMVNGVSLIDAIERIRELYGEENITTDTWNTDP